MASLINGVTCVADISRTGLNVEVLAGLHIRKFCFLELISGAATVPNNIPSLRARLEALQQYQNPPHLTIGLAPHTPYTVSFADLTATADLAVSQGRPLTLHFFETPEETQWLGEAISQTGDAASELRNFLAASGMQTDPPVHGGIELLERSGVLAARPLLAHVNYINDTDLNRLATSQASVAFCPRAHAFFGHAPHRWQDMLAAGINVCLGTDSLASNSSLSILDELRYLRRQYEDAPASTLLEMGTIRAARALGMGDSIGSLRPGKLADFLSIPIAPRMRDPIIELLDSDRRVTGVWINGQQLAFKPVDF